MPKPFLLSRGQMCRIKRFFPKPRGLPRVDGRSAMARNGRDARTRRFVRWGRRGVFECIFAALVSEAGAPERVMFNTMHLEAHRTAASLAKGVLHAASDAPKAC